MQRNGAPRTWIVLHQQERKEKYERTARRIKPLAANAAVV